MPNFNDNKHKTPVQFFTINDDEEGRRIDNYLMNRFKNVPKSHIYRVLRKGEVRVNKKRVDASYKLVEGDLVRFPPMYIDEKAPVAAPSQHTMAFLADRILYEDEYIIVLNKPSGMPVHAGNTVKVGIIEAMRQLYPKLKNLELAHRLDSETSGCLILAKKKKILREVHELLRAGKVNKTYLALTKGKWEKSDLVVQLPLLKSYHASGKHVVSVSKEGKSALSIFKTIKNFGVASLMEVDLATGRTHQIRVHAESKGHPIALDDRYGDAEFNKKMHKLGLKRMFLHAKRINFTLPFNQQHITVEAPLDAELTSCLKQLERKHD